ncbi:MAG: TolC family protein, partial [Tannerella sp.]|nr:TolC family protein [Tannerella sp.]
MKHLFLTMLLCGASFYSKAQSDDDAAGESNQRSALRMTLEQCIDYALGHNYEREATALNQTASHDLYRQSVMERRPDLSANVSENAGYSGAASSTVDGSFGLTSSLILFQGGQISGQIRKNKLVDEQSQLLTRQYDNMLVIEILHAFLAVVGGEELLNCQQSILEASAEQVKVGNDRYRLGEILESDFLLLESQFATDKNNLAQTA